MLQVARRPIRIQRSNEMIIVLHGNDESTRSVMKQRQRDGFRQHRQFSAEYYVKVRWSCFYNPTDGQEGERSVCRNRFCYYYLSYGDIDGIYEALERFEDDQASDRLANEGPSAFEFIDELAEDILRNDIQTLVRSPRLLVH